MFFYFLGFVLALVTIFGFVHSRAASENLHLQNFCVWSSSTVRRQLQEYNLFGFENYPEGNQSLDIVEITVAHVEPPELQNSNASEAIEEIRGIKLGSEGEKSQTNEEPPNEAASSSSPAAAQPSESRDSVLSAINASLRRLSSVANSGRINGAQLYQILLRETLLHEKSARAEDPDLSSAPSSSTVTLEPVTEDESAEPKPKLYFGDSPMEYVPHQD